MATKAKAPAPSVPQTLEGRLEAALGMVHQGQGAEAEPALEALVADARSAGHFGIVRAAQGLLDALRARAAKAPTEVADPLLAATLHLNRGEAEAALGQLEKAGSHGRTHYLRGLALAHLNRLDEAAAALREAFHAEPSLRHQFRLEPDFDRARRHAAFQGFSAE